MELRITCTVSYARFLSWRWRCVLCAPRPVCNHALELFELLAQFRFLSRYFFLPAAKRRSRSRRTTKHRPSPAGHPKENSKRNNATNNQWQCERDANLHPLKEYAHTSAVVCI